MGLLDDAAAKEELLDHLRDYEGNVSHFYYDPKNLITIGIGELVDSRSAVLAVRRAVAVTFANRWHSRFIKAGGGAVAAAHVLTDWDAVAALAPGSRSRAACLAACDCTLPPAARSAIAIDKVTRFYNILVARRAFMDHYHAKIQMALVDTRYNSGIDMFQQSGEVGRMWNALDPAHPLYDPLHACELFERIWRRVEADKQHYQDRVSWRVARFQEGLAHSPARRAPIWER